MTTATLYFAHDLEDGWYVLKTPEGKCITFNWSKKAKEFCEKYGWTLVFEGDEHYRPSDIPRKEL